LAWIEADPAPIDGNEGIQMATKFGKKQKSRKKLWSLKWTASWSVTVQVGKNLIEKA